MISFLSSEGICKHCLVVVVDVVDVVEVFIDNVEVVADDVIVVEVVIVEVAAEGTSNFLSCCCR